MPDSKKTKIKPDTVVYVEIDEEVTTIFERTQKIKTKKVYIVVPERSVILHNIINLKILKRKTDELDKTIILITTDPIGIQFARQSKIPVYLNLKLEEPPLDPTTSRDPDPEPEVTGRIRASDDKPTKRTQEKVSIAELQHKRRAAKLINVVNDWRKSWRLFRKEGQKHARFWNQPRQRAVAIAVVTSILILLFVAYIALPHATITITPNQQSIEQSINVTLADSEKNAGLLRQRPRRTLASYSVEAPELVHTVSYQTLGRDFQGTNAQGVVNVVNKANRSWTFVPRTQFHTENGIVFRAQDYINIAAGTEDSPTIVPINVIADPFDANGNPVGDRGNIEPTQFAIVNLGETYRPLIYGESTKPMAGGKTVTTPKVTEEDLVKAEEVARSQAIDEVTNLLQNYLDNASEYKGNKLKLLNVPGSIAYEDPQVIIPPNLLDTPTEEFEVSARVKASGVAFNENEMLNLIRNELLLRQTPDKQIAQIDEDGLTYRVVSRNNDAGILELTVTIQGVEQFDLDPQKRSGADLIIEIQENMVGLELEEAKTKITDLPEVEAVEIESSPFWSPTLPAVPDNINVVIENK